MHLPVRAALVLLALLALNGCHSIRTTPQIPETGHIAVPNIKIPQSVAFNNTAARSGNIVIGSWEDRKIYGDLRQLTESAIGAAVKLLNSPLVKVDDVAAKVLQLAVYEARVEKSRNNYTVTIALRVLTGDDLEKEYRAVQKYRNDRATTAVLERVLANCVGQILNDRDIIRYLEKVPEDEPAPAI